MEKAEKKIVPTEAVEQKALCEWLRKKGIRHFSTSMGVWFGKKNLRYIASLKSRGFEVGVPDLVILLDNGVTAFIELKRRDKNESRVRDSQKEWIEWLEKHGYPVRVCYGAVEGIKFILELTGDKYK